MNLSFKIDMMHAKLKQHHPPALESLLTSNFICSNTSDSALLVTPIQGSVSMVTLDQSFISQG